MEEVEIWKKFGSIEVSNMGNLKTIKFKDGTYTGYNTNDYKLVYVKIDNKCKSYYVHRLVSHLFNDIPLDDPRQTDHINGIKDDNRIENLRMVSVRENGQNRVEHRNGRLVGATYNTRDDIFISQIRINGKKKYIGSFKTELETHQAYMKALENKKK